MKNLIVGQSGGPTSVINASLAGVYEEAKRYYEEILGLKRNLISLIREWLLIILEMKNLQ